MSKSDYEFLRELYNMKPGATQEGFDAFLGRVDDINKEQDMSNDSIEKELPDVDPPLKPLFETIDTVPSEPMFNEHCTLKDWFAGQAMGRAPVLSNHVEVAYDSYGVADAMMKLRDK